MRLLFALLLLSAATLAYELALMRAFSIALWHHLAYMVISIALLGFGASGTLLALWKPKDTERAFALFSFLFALSLPLCFLAAQRLPLEPLLLLWDLKQSLVLAAYYMIFFLPFFFAAVAVALLLLERACQAPRVYFFNLVGSGLGALLLVVFLVLVPPARAILLIYVLAATAALLSLQTFKPRTRAGLLLVLVGGFYALHASDVLHIRLSPYKGLSTNLNLPEAEVVARRFSPLGRLEVLRSPAFRHAPGLSLVAPATPAPQLGLFLDAESAGALTRFDGRREPLAFLDWTSTAAPYHLLSEPAAARVLLLGTGGGSDVLLAFYHSTGRIEAVELNPQIIALVEETFAEFTGRPYSLPNVRPHVEEARGFVESLPEQEKFDLIQISLLDSLATATAGVHALNENFLYTVEAFDAYVEHLSPQGTLAITRWLQMPPRDTLKLFTTAVTALEERGVADPSRHLALVRSWATATLLVKRTPFTPEEIAALQTFCEERLFDLDYYPGIKPGQANRFNRLSRSYYFEAARAVLAGGERRAAFLRDYPFNVRPARDDRPYFGHFFRWEALPVLLRTYGRQWLPFFEWGYLALVATLGQAAVISFVLILLPLLLARRARTAAPSRPRLSRRSEAETPPVLSERSGDPELVEGSAAEGSLSRGANARGAQSRGHWRVFTYFLAIGLGYLFIEMMLIQKFTFFLANPIYSVAVVLTGVLVWSGLGSLAAGRLFPPRFTSDTGGPARRSLLGVGGLPLVCAGITLLTVTAALLLPRILPPLIDLSAPARAALSLLLMAPLAFLMGMPFPLAWQRLQAARPALLPWAWGVNGCASVLASVLATLLAMSFGFRVVLFCAAALYLLAGVTSPPRSIERD